VVQASLKALVARLNAGGFEPIPRCRSRAAAIVAVLSLPKQTGKADVT
jgi:hypothetical protein